MGIATAIYRQVSAWNHVKQGKKRPSEDGCESAWWFDPPSASNFDPYCNKIYL
jgi:hypothetical protein